MKLIFAGKEPFYDNFVSLVFDYTGNSRDAEVIVSSPDFEPVIELLTQEHPEVWDENFTIYRQDWRLFGVNEVGILLEFDCDFNLTLETTWRLKVNAT